MGFLDTIGLVAHGVNSARDESERLRKMEQEQADTAWERASKFVDRNPEMAMRAFAPAAKLYGLSQPTIRGQMVDVPAPGLGGATTPAALSAQLPTIGGAPSRFGLNAGMGVGRAASLPTIQAPATVSIEDASRPDWKNPENVAAVRDYIGMPPPKPETFSLGYGEQRYSQVPGQAPKLVATGGAKPIADKDPRYDIDPVTGEVKPVVPGTRFGVKPDKGDKDTSAKDYQRAYSDWQKDGARYVNDYVSLMARNSQRTRVQNGVTMTVPPTPEQMKAWRAEGEALYKASVDQPMPPGGSGKPDPFANPKSPSAQKVSGGTARWAKQITAASQATGVPEAIIRAVMRQESGGNPSARSPVGAIGLMQFMPGTAAGMGINPADPDQAVLAGAKYLKANFDKFGSWKKAIAAYNAGPGAVQRYGGIPPYKETQGYVQRIADDLKAQGIEISAADAAKAASLYEKYGITPGAANA